MPVPFETVAVKVVEPPEQIVAFVELTDTEGSGTTVTNALFEVALSQPLPV